MFMMENAEEIFHFLEEFSKRKPKTIPQELNEYLAHVARTGDPIYQWSLVKSLFKEKLLNVITDFYEATPSIEIPPYPNVDPFNYDIMKNSLLERLDSFTSAPFTVQRICELLTYPRKQYNRVDKFMRAVEKNILVVSTREPGTQRHVEPENGEPIEPIVNGTDNSEYNVDVEMEDMSWKENADRQLISEPQPSSSDAHISVDDIEARLQTKQVATIDTHEKTTPYESVTPPELNVVTDDKIKPSNQSVPDATTSDIEIENKEKPTETVTSKPTEETKVDVDMKPEEPTKDPLEIPDIKIDDAEMTEQRLKEESNAKAQAETIVVEKETSPETGEEILPTAVSSIDESSSDSNTKESIDESSSDSTVKEESEPKVISEVSTSSEESSSSSDNTDGNSNSPRTDMDTIIDVQEEISQPNVNLEAESKQPEEPKHKEPEITDDVKGTKESPPQIESENYSITDVNSELPQPPAKPCNAEDPKPVEAEKKDVTVEEKKDEQKSEIPEINVESKKSEIL